MSGAGRFLSRWSRLKRQAEVAPVESGPVAPAPVPAAQSDDEPRNLRQGEGEAPAPAAARETPHSQGKPQPLELPPLETLSVHSDISAYLKKEVGESLRRAALRKLFSDPHFNQMDGLDVYVDDYSVSAPIPDDIMKRLRQFQTFLEDEKTAAVEEKTSADEEVSRAAVPDAAQALPQPQASEAVQHGTQPLPDASSGPDCDSLTAGRQKVAQEAGSGEDPRKKADSSG